VQQLHLDGVRQELSDRIGVPGNGVDGSKQACGAFEWPRHGLISRGRITGDVNGRGRIGVHSERSRDTLFGRQQTCQVSVDLTDLTVRARYGNAIASRRARRSAHKVVVLVGSEYEQRVTGIDSVFGKAGEKCCEGAVVRLQRGHVSSLSRTIGGTAWMLVV